MKKTTLLILFLFFVKQFSGTLSAFEKCENIFWEQEVSNSDGDEKNNESEKSDSEDDSEKNKYINDNQYILFSKKLSNSIEMRNISFLSKGNTNQETPPPIAIG